VALQVGPSISGVLQEFSILGAQYITSGPDLGVHDHGKSIARCKRDKVGLSSGTLTEWRNLESKTAKCITRSSFKKSAQTQIACLERNLLASR